MTTLATLVIKLTGDVSGFAKSMGEAESRVQSAAGMMTRAGTLATAGITVPLMAAGAAAIHFGQDLNRGMANVASLGVASERVIELKTAVQDMAIATGKSTTDLAQGLYQVVSAFGDTADSADILKTNAMAAAAGLSTTTEAINLTSAVTKGYGDTTAEAVQRVADLALKTVQLGQTTFPELAGAMGRVVPIAANLNVTQQELFTTMATLTGVTGTASEVGTQLRGTLQSLMAPTSDMSGLIETLGFKSGAAMMEELGLHGSILAIVQAAEASGTPLQKYIGSIEGQTLALALAGPQAETYQQKLAAMAGAAGTTQAAFEAQTQGINANGFAMEQARIKMEVFFQRIYDGLAPALSRAIDAAQPLVDAVMGLSTRFAELDPKTQTVIVGALALAAAIGPVLAILGLMLPVLGAVGAVLGALSAPVLLVVAAVAALGLAWATNFGGIRDKTMEWWASIQPALEEARRILEEVVGAAVERLAALWNEHWPAMRATLEEVWAVIQDILGAAWEALWGNVGTVVDGTITAIEGYLDGMHALLSGAVQIVKDILEGDWAGAWETAQTATEGFRAGVETALSGLSQVVDGVFGTIWDTITGTSDRLLNTDLPRWAEFKEGVVEKWELLKKGIGEKIDDILERAKTWLEDTKKKIEEFDLKKAAVAMWETAKKGLVEMAEKMLKAAVQWLDDTLYAIENFDFKAAARTAFDTVVVGTGEKLGDALKKAGTWLDDTKKKIEQYDFKAAARKSFDTVVVGTGEKLGDALKKAGTWLDDTKKKIEQYDFKAAAKTAFDTMVVGTADKLGEALKNVGTWLTDVATKIRGKDFKSDTLTSFATVVAGILEKAADIYLEVGNFLTTSATKIREFSLHDAGVELIQGLVNGITSMAQSVAAAAAQVVRDAIAAARAALWSHSPSRLAAQEIGEPFTQGIAMGILQAMDWLVEAVSTVAQGVTTAGVEEFSGAVRAVAEAVGPALEALAALAGWDMDAGDLEGRMQALAGHVEALVGFVRVAADKMTSEGLAAAREFGESAGPVVEIVAEGVAALVALGGLAAVDGSRIDERMAAFADIMGGLVQHMRRAAGYFTEEMLAAAVAFGEAVGPITEPIEQGVGALSALSGLAQVDGSRIDARMSAFADIMGGLTVHMRRAAGYFTQEMLDAAAAFGAAIGPITEPIEQGVGALVALGDLAEVDGRRIDGRMSAFADLMGGLTVHMRRVSGYFTQEMLDAAVAFGQAIGPITEPIEQGVGALVALAGAAWGDAGNLVAKMQEFAAYMYILANVMGATADSMKTGTVEAAKRFGAAVTAAVEPVEDGLDALSALMEAGVVETALVAERMVMFAANMTVVVNVLAWTGDHIDDGARQSAGRFGEFAVLVGRIVEAMVGAANEMMTQGVTASANFKWAAERMSENVLVGLLSASGLEGWGSGLPQIMQAITQAVVGAMWNISSAWQSLSVAGYQFGYNWVSQIVNGIRSRLGVLEALLAYIRGLFPSSPARFGAWRELPDGAGVGAAFVGDLAGALGGDPVGRALDGLHGLFGGMGAGGGLDGDGRYGQNGQVTVVINNPVGEPAEASLVRQMRNLAAVGVL